MDNKKKQSDTILNFLYISNENENLNKYFDSVQLEYAKMTLYFKDLNYLIFNIELKENCFYYLEMLKIKTKKNTLIEANYYIYAHKKNNIYIDIPKEDQVNKDITVISMLILYQSIDNKLLPYYINYDNKKLNCFDTFQNNLRKRISLINIDTNKFPLINEILKKYPDASFEKDNSYEIYVRIPIDGDIKYSGVDLDLVNCNRLKNNKSEVDKVEIDKKKILNFLKLFKDEVFKSFINKIDEVTLYNQKNIQKIKERINDFYTKYKILGYNAIYYYDNILTYDKFETDDIDIFIEIFYFLEFLQISKNLTDSEEKKEKEKIIEEKEEINKEKKYEVRKGIKEGIQKQNKKIEKEEKEDKKEKEEKKEVEDLENEILLEEDGKKEKEKKNLVMKNYYLYYILLIYTINNMKYLLQKLKT